MIGYFCQVMNMDEFFSLGYLSFLYVIEFFTGAIRCAPGAMM